MSCGRPMFLLQHFLRRAAEHAPNRTALDDGTRTLTYAELETTTDTVARNLQASGVGRHTRVLVGTPTSIDAVVTVFGVLKAGATYVPVEMDTSKMTEAYLEGIIDRTDPSAVIISNEQQRPRSFPSRVPVHLINNLTYGAPNLRLAAQHNCDADIAYIHFTSGSTGISKGVATSHRAAIEYFAMCEEVLRLEDPPTVGVNTPLLFDLSEFDIHFTVRCGGMMVFAPMNSTLLLLKRKISLLYKVPSVISALASGLERFDGAGGNEEFGEMRNLIFAGERCPIDALRVIRAFLPQATLHHWYGSTEAPLVTAFAMPPRSEIPDPLPIGRSVPNVDLAMIGEGGGLFSVSAGSQGELAVSSSTLLSGYFNNAEATAKALFRATTGPNQIMHSTWYKTGDVLRADQEGVLFFEGRTDRSVKVQAVPVDLDYVEATISRIPGVSNNVVIDLPDKKITTRIECFVLGAPDLEPALKAEIDRRLELSMRPVQIHMMPQLPMTASGKIDRKTLKARRLAARIASENLLPQNSVGFVIRRRPS